MRIHISVEGKHVDFIAMEDKEKVPLDAMGTHTQAYTYTQEWRDIY